MKIKSVEVQAQHPEDGTNSTSSIEDAPPIDYEKTVDSLTQALNELHMELRDRTSENEALLATASSLSDALKETDRMLQEKSMECERLQLKLQMVTFVERNEVSFTSLDGSDHDSDVLHASWSNEIEMNEAIPSADLGKVESSTVPSCKSKSTKKKSSSTGKERVHSGEKASKSLHASASSTDDGETNHSPATKVAYSGPVSVDDFDDSSPEMGPRQAHFYNALLERDRALSAAKKLKKELSYAKGKVRDLQTKLDKSNLLVEISYQHEESQKKKQRMSLSMVQDKLEPPERATARKSLSNVSESSLSARPESARKLMTRKWLRTAVLSARKKEGDGDEPFETLVTDDEKLSSKWNNKYQGSKNEATYLEAIVGNDADRAGGHGSIRFQL